MSDTTSNHIIQYIADVDSVFNKVNELVRLNKLAAEKLGTDFSTAIDVVDQKYTKLKQTISQVPDLSQPIAANGTRPLKEQITVLGELTSTVKTADGSLRKIVETQTTVDATTKRTTTSITSLKAELEKPATVFLGSLENITAQLGNLDRISKQVQGSFGSGAKVASVGTPKVASLKTQNVIVDGAAVAQQTQIFDTSVKLIDGSSKVLRDTLVSVNGQVTKTSSTFVDASKSSRSFADSLKTLATRAAFTIPIWFALRAAIFGVFNTVRTGLSDIVTFDTALQKLRINLQGTPTEIERDFNKAKQTITDFSRETGISTEEIVESVRKFSTIGFDFEDALVGGILSTKLAIALFGDASETANTFARSIKILADETKGATSVQEQMAEAFALTAKLEKTNQFDLNEVNESLIKFAPTAKSAGLSLRETLVLLATLGTAGRTGSNAGTLLSTSVNELRGNLDKLAGSLGVSVNPNLDTTFQVITKVLDKAKQLGKIDSLGARQAQALAEVFGGEKGTKTISSLIALNEVFKENNKIIASASDLEKQFITVNDTLGNNVRKLSNDLKEDGKAFANALVGGRDFNETIKILDRVARDAAGPLKFIGDELHILFTGLSGGVPALIDDFFSKLENIDENKLQKSLDVANQINRALQGKSTKNNLSKLIVDLKNGDIKLQNVPTDKLVAALEKELNKAVIKEVTVKVQSANISFLTLKESQDLNKSIIQDQLDILKTQGASTSELLKQESLLNKTFNIYEDENTILQRSLATQRAISEERRLQSRLGSESIKLFEIAQKDGVEIAQTIGRVLAGQTDFGSFVRAGGKELEIFKRDFESIFQQQQAQAFFKGEQIPGLESLNGGTQIPIQEQILQNGLPSTAQAQLASAQAKAELPTIRAEINNRITATIGVEVQGLSFREAIRAFKAELARDLQNPESEFSKQIDSHVEAI